MNLKNLAIGSLLATSLIFVGCGDDDTTPAVDAGGSDVPAVDTGPGDLDAGTPEPLPGCDGECFFVVNALNIPGPDPVDGTVVGANLDDEVTNMDNPLGGCGVEDYTHPDGTEGVDNALARIVPTIIEPMLDEPIADQLGAQIASGSLLITVALSGVDGANDSDVMGTLFPDGAIPGDAAPALEADGTLSPGQTIDIASEAINIPGAIVDGRFTASLPNFPVSIPVADVPLVLNVSQAIISADITENGLENAEIAGSLSIEELATAIGAADVGIDAEGALGLLQGFGDIEPNETGDICARISLGLGLSAVPAIQGTTL